MVAVSAPLIATQSAGFGVVDGLGSQYAFYLLDISLSPEITLMLKRINKPSIWMARRANARP